MSDASERLLRADQRIAAVVRSAPMAALPADFAHDVARLARAGAGQTADAGRVEQSLVTTLGLVLAGAAAWYGMPQASSWLAPLGDLLPDASTLAWVAAAGGCIGANWLLGRPALLRNAALPGG